MTRWLRLYGSMVDDPKVGGLTDSQHRLWVDSLCLACAAGADGDTIIKPKDFSWRVRRPINQSDIETLVAEGLLSISESGTVVVNNWRERQFLSDSSAERVRRHRERKSQAATSGPSNVTVTGGNVTETLETRVTPPDTDTDTEKKQTQKKKSPKMVDGSLFTEFWGQYPRKQAKQDAAKAWFKIAPGPDLFTEIMEGLSAARGSEQWKKDDGRFIPLPATWLNGARWEDEAELGAAEKTGGAGCGYTPE